MALEEGLNSSNGIAGGADDGGLNDGGAGGNNTSDEKSGLGGPSIARRQARSRRRSSRS